MLRQPRLGVIVRTFSKAVSDFLTGRVGGEAGTHWDDGPGEFETFPSLTAFPIGLIVLPMRLIDLDAFEILEAKAGRMKQERVSYMMLFCALMLVKNATATLDQLVTPLVDKAKCLAGKLANRIKSLKASEGRVSALSENPAEFQSNGSSGSINDILTFCCRLKRRGDLLLASRAGRTPWCGSKLRA